jgi:predicted ArsR family transcriptional regulator
VIRTSQGSVAPRANSWLEMIADPIRLGILRSLSQVAEATTADLASWGQASSQTLRRHLDALVSVGLILEHPAQSDGETPGRPAARFSLSAEMRESVRSVLHPSEPAPVARRARLGQAVGVPAMAATLVSTTSIAAAGPMNGASAT